MSIAAAKKKLIKQLNEELSKKKTNHSKQKISEDNEEDDCDFWQMTNANKNKFIYLGSFSTTLIDEDARLSFIKRTIETRQQSTTKVSHICVHIAMNSNSFAIHSAANCDVMTKRPLDELCDVICDFKERMLVLVLRHRENPHIVCHLFEAEKLVYMEELTQVLKENNAVNANFSTLADITDYQ